MCKYKSEKFAQFKFIFKFDIKYYEELENPNEILLADAGETLPKLPAPNVASLDSGFRSN